MPEFSLKKKKSKMTGDYCAFETLFRVEGKHLMRFLSETSVFNFLRGSVDGVLRKIASPYVSLIPHLLAVGRPC